MVAEKAETKLKNQKKVPKAPVKTAKKEKLFCKNKILKKRGPLTIMNIVKIETICDFF